MGYKETEREHMYLIPVPENKVCTVWSYKRKAYLDQLNSCHL
jgi:hypothetical protein